MLVFDRSSALAVELDDIHAGYQPREGSREIERTALVGLTTVGVGAADFLLARTVYPSMLCRAFYGVGVRLEPLVDPLDVAEPRTVGKFGELARWN
jgi:hypothetical protein